MSGKAGNRAGNDDMEGEEVEPIVVAEAGCESWAASELAQVAHRSSREDGPVGQEWPHEARRGVPTIWRAERAREEQAELARVVELIAPAPDPEDGDGEAGAEDVPLGSFLGFPTH